MLSMHLQLQRNIKIYIVNKIHIGWYVRLILTDTASYLILSNCERRMTNYTMSENWIHAFMWLNKCRHQEPWFFFWKTLQLLYSINLRNFFENQWGSYQWVLLSEVILPIDFGFEQLSKSIKKWVQVVLGVVFLEFKFFQKTPFLNRSYYMFLHVCISMNDCSGLAHTRNTLCVYALISLIYFTYVFKTS